jgi:hypothetical protein
LAGGGSGEDGTKGRAEVAAGVGFAPTRMAPFFPVLPHGFSSTFEYKLDSPENDQPYQLQFDSRTPLVVVNKYQQLSAYIMMISASLYKKELAESSAHPVP